MTSLERVTVARAVANKQATRAEKSSRPLAERRSRLREEKQRSPAFEAAESERRRCVSCRALRKPSAGELGAEVFQRASQKP